MDTRVLASTSELLELASKRIKLPRRKPIFVNYDEEGDSLFIKLSEKEAVISKSAIEGGVAYDLDENGNIVGIEIFDLYDIFASA